MARPSARQLNGLLWDVTIELLIQTLWSAFQTDLDAGSFDGSRFCKDSCALEKQQLRAFGLAGQVSSGALGWLIFEERDTEAARMDRAEVGKFCHVERAKPPSSLTHSDNWRTTILSEELRSGLRNPEMSCRNAQTETRSDQNFCGQ